MLNLYTQSPSVTQLLAKRKKPSLLTKNAVVMEPDERRVHRIMQQINTIKNDKLEKKKAKSGMWAAMKASCLCA